MFLIDAISRMNLFTLLTLLFTECCHHGATVTHSDISCIWIEIKVIGVISEVRYYPSEM
jgi:hypothetical protein